MTGCPECQKCPEPNGFLRRFVAVGGLLFMFAAIALKAFVAGVSDWLVILLALAGAALVPNTKVVDLVTALQRKLSA